MLNERGCYYVDGSYLFSSIERIKKEHTELKDKKLNIAHLSHSMIRQFSPFAQSSLRVIYYFKDKDPRIKSKLTIPSPHGQQGHWQIRECGTNLRIKQIPQDELEKLSEEYRDVYPRAEKGVDMELACDALTLAASGRVQNFVFMINDRDFIPLLSSIQKMGCNTYIVGLDVKQSVQASILNMADTYLTLESDLWPIFEYTPPLQGSA